MGAAPIIPGALLALCAGAAGCVPSNVVATTDRSVAVESDAAAWQAATAADVPGFYRSGTMTGAVASALWRIEYLFQPDGTFTGAALFAGPPPAFEVLSGTWSLDADGRLVLDDAEPADLDAAPGLLRLRGPDGSVILYREDLR